MSNTPADDDAPKSATAKALAAVPVALTVLATILAGLSSSEMTRSMYYRSLAAQHQSKAGSQWAFFAPGADEHDRVSFDGSALRLAGKGTGPAAGTDRTS